MTLFTRLFCLVLLLALGSPVFALASTNVSRQIAVTPVYDTGGLEPGKPVKIHVLVTIEAPAIAEVKKRGPVAVSLVIDRSSSMAGDKKIDYAVKAGKLLVNTLRADDLFSLVAYDSRVEVLYPLAEAKDKRKILDIIDRIRPQSTTFLSGGLEEGIRQLEKARGEFPSRVILLSDGQANRGVTAPEGVAEIGAKSRNRGVNVSTVGLGLSFNEDLMQLLAQRGGGQYYYIEDSEDLPGVFRQELNLVVKAFTKNMRASFNKAPFVGDVTVYGYTSSGKEGDVAIDMGDLSAGEKRQLMMQVALTPPESVGEQTIGTFNFKYVDPDSGQMQHVAVPVNLEITADPARLKALAEERAAAIREVTDEVLLLEAEQARMQAARELERGNVDQARNILRQKQKELAGVAKDNVVARNKAEQLEIEERNLEAMRASPKAMMAYSKGSKAAAYKMAQGKKQDTILKRGDTGYRVERLQRALKEAGFWQKDPDGVFSPELETAVKAFQKSKNMAEDGIVGPGTRLALGI